MAFTVENVITNVYNNDYDYLQKWGMNMKISYKKLWLMLVERELSKATLRKDLRLSAGTLTKLNKGEEVSLSILLRICDYFNCDIGDICEAVRK